MADRDEDRKLGFTRSGALVLCLTLLLGACAPLDEGWSSRESRDGNVGWLRQPLVPAVGPEFALDQPVFLGDTPNSQSAPQIAFDGTNYLVAWQDTRVLTDVAMYATRVTPTGEILAPGGTFVARTRYAHPFGIAFDGRNFLLVWNGTFDSALSIYAARVDTTGVVLDDPPILVSQGTASRFAPKVASNGSGFFVAWNDLRNADADGDGDVYAARVSSQGAVLDPEGIPIATGLEDEYGPVLASDGKSYLVVWQEREDLGLAIHGRRFSPDGSVVDAESVTIADAGALSPSVAFDGTNYLVVYSRNGAGSESDIHGTRIGSEGGLIDASPIPIATSTSSESSPSVAFIGSNYLVAWLEAGPDSGRDVVGARVTPAGELLDPPKQPLLAAPGDDSAPVVAGRAGQSLVVAANDQAWGRVLGTLLSPELSPLPPGVFIVNIGPNAQQNPAIAFDGANYLAVWSDSRNIGKSGRDLFGIRVNPSGTAALDPTAFAIFTGDSDQSDPDIAFDGENYLIVWQNGAYGVDSDIFAARVTKNGAVLGVIPICTEASLQSEPAVAYDGTNYLVAWSDARDFGSSLTDIYAARVTPDGSVLEPDGTRISRSSERDSNPAIAAGSGQLLMVWGNGSTLGIRGTRLVTTDPLLVRADAEEIVIVQGLGQHADPAVAYDGTNWFVVWSSRRDQPSYGQMDIYAARVDESGQVLDAPGVRISSDPENEVLPALGFDGSSYVVAWRRGSHDDHDLVSTRFQLAGLTREPTREVIAPRETLDPSWDRPGLATNGAARSLVLYERIDAALRVERVFARSLATQLADGTRCTLDVACASEHCVDGVCCNTACTRQCEVCDIAGREGTCAAVSGAPRGSRPACAGDGACQGHCNGTDPNGCVYPGTDTECAPTGCAVSIERAAAVCDGSGACSKAQQTSCAPYACGEADCLTSCSEPSHCAAGYECSDGQCRGEGGSAAAPTTPSEHESSCGCRLVGAHTAYSRFAWIAGIAFLLSLLRFARSAAAAQRGDFSAPALR